MNKLFWLLTTLLLLALTGCGNIDWFPDASKPNAFSFPPQRNVALNTQVTSAAVTITGNSIPADITIENGEYSIGSSSSGSSGSSSGTGTFTSSPGKISAGQTVTVRHTSASTANTDTRTVVTIGGVSAAFVSTTGSPAPQAFTFAPMTSVRLNSQVTSAAVTITGNTAPAAVTIVNGQYSIDGGDFTSAAGTINAGQTIRLQQTTASTTSTQTTTTVTVGGVSATFVTTTQAKNPNPPTALPAGTTDSTGTFTLVDGGTFYEAFRNSTSVTEQIIVDLSYTTTTPYYGQIGFAALDAADNVVYTGYIQGLTDGSGDLQLQTNATIDSLTTYASIARWIVFSITATPAP
jgi:hypothetical protein